MQNFSVPQGFAMALAQNKAAVSACAMMTMAEKERVLEKAGKIRSKQQMQTLVTSLAQDQIT